MVTYLLSDGKGDTRALVNASGTVTATLNYDVFDNALDFDPATVGTMWLTSDAMFDSVSGLYFHGSGRQSDNVRGRWITADDLVYVRKMDPMTGNLYLLDHAEPGNRRDFNGHMDFNMTSVLTTTGIGGALIGMLMPAHSAAQRAEHALVGLVVGLQIGLLALEAAPLISAYGQFYYGFALAGAGAGAPIDIAVAENAMQELQTEETAFFMEGEAMSGESAALQNKMRDLRQLVSNQPGYSCDEAAEALYNANGGTGAVIRIEPKIANGINEISVPQNVNGYTSNQQFIYHEAYTDRQFVYDPFLSHDPIPEKDYLAKIAQLNPDATVTFKKL